MSCRLSIHVAIHILRVFSRLSSLALLINIEIYVGTY
jgi:hypothetical protein